MINVRIADGHAKLHGLSYLYLLLMWRHVRIAAARMELRAHSHMRGRRAVWSRHVVIVWITPSHSSVLRITR